MKGVYIGIGLIALMLYDVMRTRAEADKRSKAAAKARRARAAKPAKRKTAKGKPAKRKKTKAELQAERLKNLAKARRVLKAKNKKK